MSENTPPVCSYEGSDYQESFWEKGGRAYEDAVEAVALKRLLPPSGKWMLELGAGAGRNTPRYAGYEHVVLLDYSRTQLEQAQARLGAGGRYIYVAADIYRLPFVPALFDGATMIRTLHHMADAPRALMQVAYTLQSDAVFILEFANKQNLKAMLRYALGRQKWSPYSPEPVEFVELNYDFHPAAVRDWLRKCGFEIERQLTVSHYRSPFFKKLFPLSWLVALDSFAQLTGNWWQLSPSVFVRSHKTAAAPVSKVEGFFRCPACSSVSLKETTGGMECTGCKRIWPVVNGIYDFRADQPAVFSTTQK
jgi:ubiquinone/menaquinone biosynthesis C-methylase UbiE